MGIYNQQEYDIRFEWGLCGVEELATVSDVVIIVDILSFSTCVDVATARGADVYPYKWKDNNASAFAAQIGAELAGPRSHEPGSYSLSPVSLLQITPGTKLVLPSPNGSTLSLSTGNTTTLCGCLRNAAAIAGYAIKKGSKIAVIAAGEQWPDGGLRPAFEDVVGAGAIISYLKGSLSPESYAALSAFKATDNIHESIKQCSSGKELIARGFEEDILLACNLNACAHIPILTNGVYTSRDRTA